MDAQCRMLVCLTEGSEFIWTDWEVPERLVKISQVGRFILRVEWGSTPQSKGVEQTESQLL